MAAHFAKLLELRRQGRLSPHDIFSLLAGLNAVAHPSWNCWASFHTNPVTG